MDIQFTYDLMIAFYGKLLTHADSHAGVWKFSKSSDYYQTIIDEIDAKMGDVFGVLPKGKVEVKPVSAFLTGYY